MLAGAIMLFMFLRKRSMIDILPILTDSERRVMEILLREKKGVDQRKIVKETEFSKAKISRVIQDLSDRGLVERTRKGRTNIINVKRPENMGKTLNTDAKI